MTLTLKSALFAIEAVTRTDWSLLTAPRGTRSVADYQRGFMDGYIDGIETAKRAVEIADHGPTEGGK